MKFLLAVVSGAAGLAVAAWLFDDITVGGSEREDELLTLLMVAVIFGVVNAIVRPVVAVLSLPLYILTLGLFFVVVNALMLMLTSWIAAQIGVAFGVDGFWTALFGGIVISLVSTAVSLLRPTRER
jgi:putative membrane protein